MSSPDGHLVSFSHVQPDLRPRALERFARKLRDEVAGGREFHCRITGDAELRRLNRDFLGKDYATDVLSFPSGGGDSLGDLAVSAARARAQAREHAHDIGQEIGILMLHGLLHLLGMDHDSDGGRMARAEVRWRRKLGLPAGLIERCRTGLPACPTGPQT